MFTVNVTNVSR